MKKKRDYTALLAILALIATLPLTVLWRTLKPQCGGSSFMDQWIFVSIVFIVMVGGAEFFILLVKEAIKDFKALRNRD